MKIKAPAISASGCCWNIGSRGGRGSSRSNGNGRGGCGGGINTSGRSMICDCGDCKSNWVVAEVVKAKEAVFQRNCFK